MSATTVVTHDSGPPKVVLSAARCGVFVVGRALGMR